MENIQKSKIDSRVREEFVKVFRSDFARHKARELLRVSVPQCPDFPWLHVACFNNNLNNFSFFMHKKS